MTTRANAIIEKLPTWGAISDPRDVPGYSIADAAHYLRMPAATVRSWALGRPYDVAKGTRRWQALIEPAQAEPPPPLLSFLNLVELHVLRAMRRDHELKVPVIRSALEYVTQRLGVQRPLVHVEFQTDGVHLFVERLGELVSVSQGGQRTLEGVLKDHLARIERDERGLAQRLFPFVRDPSRLDDPMNVMIDPRFAFGRPALRESGITTRAILERWMAGESPAELARDYGRTVAEIDDAVRAEYRPIAA